MASALRFVILLAAVVMIIDVATPPVIETHLELGFCSADCPVQHAASGAAIAPPAPPRPVHRRANVVDAVARADEAEIRSAGAPDVPRAPPVA
jgi:hypothetical protein